MQHHCAAAFEDWLAGNAVMKRTFRSSATIAGLIQRNLPQARKSGRQATFSSDILYDTLSKYDPEHLMLQITREEALRGLVDFGRIEEIAGAHARSGRSCYFTPDQPPRRTHDA